MASRLIVIAGPTASGKTSLSLSLAEAIGAEIFSADARQFYKGMDIGTAKPTKEEMQRIPHHFIDHLDPSEAYSAGQYARDLQDALTEYFKTKDNAIVVGGSGFYIKAAIEGLDDLPTTSPEIRAHYNGKFEAQGLKALQEELKAEDPVYFERIDQDNRQRVQRALEAIAATGKPFSEQQKGAAQQLPWTVQSFCIEGPRDELYARINDRVDEMMANGLEGEAQALYPLRSHNALQTVGYQELFDYFDGKWDLDVAVSKIKQHTRNYAKRQITWFKKQPIDHRINKPTLKSILRHL